MHQALLVTHTSRPLSVLAIAAITAACVVPVRQPAGRHEPEPGEVRFELAGPGGAALLVPVRVNGAGPFPFVLDTGATLTCVDEALMEELSLPEQTGSFAVGGTIGGMGRMRLVGLDSIEVGTARATDLQACVLDLAPMRKAGLEFRGLLGLNFLRGYRVTLDFSTEMLRLDPPADSP
jgi:predicted aspartyl protease